MILFGASGHCKSVLDIARSIREPITAIYDDNPVVDSIYEVPVTKYTGEGYPKNVHWIITIGNNKIRKEVSKKLPNKWGVLWHETAYLSPYQDIAEGTVVMAKAVVNAGTVIGQHCIINSGAVIEHDCTLADFVHISPNASLAGGVTVGEGSHIGIGACVLPEIKIGKWATIGAGAVIIKDVPDGAVVVGNPGRIIKYNND